MLMSPADEAWVKELYEANALKLYKVAFRRLGDKDEAENVVQEAFLLLLARFDTVRVHPNPSGWLMKVVQNLIRHSMDRNQKQSSHEISIEEQITFFRCAISCRRASPSGNRICWSGAMRKGCPTRRFLHG